MDTSGWKNLESEDGLGRAYMRWNMLAKDDPYVGMFTEHVITRLGIAVTNVLGNGDNTTLVLPQYPEGVREQVYEALQSTPLAKMLSMELKSHITDLWDICIYPEGT